MKSKNNSFLRIAAMLALGTSAQATPYYWDNTSPIETSGFGTAGGTWGTEAKWSTSSTGDVTPGIIAPTTSDDLFFGTDTGTFGLADGTITVDGTVNAGNLTFGSQSGGITLSGGTAINLAATSTITVNNPSTTISNTITGATTLNKAGSGTLILGHATNTLPDAVALNISAGKIDFGANTDTIGIVGMTGGQIGGTSGTLTTARVNVSSTTTAEMTGGNINSGSATARGLAVGSNTTATFTISGGTFTSNSPNSDPSSGNNTSFIGNGASGNGTLVIDGGAYVGNGVLKLGYFASGSGTLTIKSGSATIKTLIYDAAATTGGSAIVNLNGGTLTVSDIRITSGATKQFNFDGGTLTTATGVDLPSTKFAGLTMTVNAGGAKIETLDRTITINQALLAGTGTGGLTKSGSGTLSLGGANSYSGVTAISAGILNVASLSDYGVNGSLGNRLASAETATGDGIGIRIGSGTAGATLQYTGSTAQSTNRQIRLSAANNTIDASGTGAGTLSFTYSGANSNLFDTAGARTLTLTGSNTGNNTFAISLTDEVLSRKTSLTKNGAGTWVLTGASTYTGATTISGGGILSVSSLPTTGDTSSNLGLTSAIQIGGGSSSGTLLYTGAAKTTDRGIFMSGGTPGSYVILDQSGTGLLKFTGNFTNASAGITKTLTLQGSTAGTGEISGSIQEGAGGMVTSLTKAGTGTWTLSGTNTYTGNTTVNNGALEVTSSGSLRFRPTTNSVTNSVSGTATASLSFLGTVSLDLTAADTTLGNSWPVFNLGSFTTPPVLTPVAVTSTTLGSFSEVSPGVWELPVTGAKWVFTKASGNLTYATAATDYDTWMALYPSITAPADKLPGADPDGDGLSNQQEYAFGLAPNSGSSVNPITSPLSKTTGKFSYTRRATPAATGLTYTVWTSVDLVTWTPDSAATSSQTVTGTTAGVETVEATLPGTLPLTAPKLFIQVRAQ